MRTALVISMSWLAALAACDSEEMPPEELRCDEETRADEIAPGMVMPGEAGSYDVRLVEGDPMPPAKGDSSWLVEILDASTDAPVDGATITVTPFMPDHGHGTPVQAEIAPTGATGQFQVDRINLWMPGFWEVRFGIDAGSATDDAVFRLCIEG